jgi:exodeoxyribonuclease III
LEGTPSVSIRYDTSEFRVKDFGIMRDMKLVSWNVNGIRAIQRKNLFVPAVKALKPDIICLQETKAEKGQAEIDLPEYEEYWNSSTGKKGYSGTAIFTKMKPKSIALGYPDDLVQKYKLVEDKFGDPNKEGRVIAAEFDDFFVVIVYTPNAKGDLGRLSLRHTIWDPIFLAYAKKLEKKKPVIFCGDLNVAHTYDDLTNPKANEGGHGFTKEEREGIDNIIAAGFVDTFRLFTKGNGHYTWWSVFSNARARNVGWRIDYFFVSKALVPKVKSAKIHADLYGSDHCPVSLELK